MKVLFRVAMMAAAATASGAVWFGCSSDSGTGTDGGADGQAPADSGGGQDTGSPADSGGPSDGGADVQPGDSGGGDGGGMDASIALNCSAYCTAMMQVCGTSGPNQQYLDLATCNAMCAKLTVGDAGVMTGNTLSCRVYHLSVAAQSAQNATTHCPHAGPYGFGQCGSECENFCALYSAQCGANTWGGNCANQCPNINNLSSTSFIAATGNTLDCREYHLENAYQANNTNGAGHCAHATSGGGMVCQ